MNKILLKVVVLVRSKVEGSAQSVLMMFCTGELVLTFVTGRWLVA